ncbi:phage/plasmid primase, P4 family [Mesorhizobium sp. M1252]|uniref:phage/plasmid primase, P4 family n=1 Tax=Mesorhizobium sp. M1252 TaxID=2957073 RepID=UPI00333BEFAF
MTRSGKSTNRRASTFAEIVERRRFPSPIEHQAVAFARNGHRVLPLFGIVDRKCECGKTDCAHPGKHPRIAGGVREASSDIHVIEGWCERWPSMNLGFATGGKKGIFVLDVDGAEGHKSLRRLEHDHGKLPRTLTVRTGRGFHLYFHAVQAIGNSAGTKLGKGLDVRGKNGYVLTHWSRHISGTIYKSPDPKAKVARTPTWLIRLLVTDELGGLSSNVPSADAATSSSSSAIAWAQSALAAELEKMRTAVHGSRNATLNGCAYKLGQLVGGEALSEDEVARQLTNCARLVGLEDDEIKGTLASGLSAGRANPRFFQRDVAAGRAGVNPLAKELSRLGQTDSDLAVRFAQQSEGSVIFTPARGFLAFDGRIWREDSQLKRFILAEKVARAITDELPYLTDPVEKAARARFGQQALSKGSLDRMLELARSHIVVADAKIDVQPWHLNVRNGTLDLRTGALHNHQASDLLTKMANIDFDEKARCPRFESFLRHALRDDEDLITFVRKAVGLSLTGDVRNQIFFFLHGQGKTGKSTFVNLIRDLLGDYGLHTPTETLLARQYDSGIPADLARLAGSRMVTAIEANWDRNIDEARIKAMTGGEPIVARLLYKNHFHFQPEFKLWFVANDYPNVRGSAEAFWERVRVIPFTVQIPPEGRDLGLSEKLRDEASGILNWALRGCLEYQKSGIIAPAGVTRANSSWQKDADHIRKFADDMLIREDGNILSASHLHRFYETWCRKHGETRLSMAGLKKQLEAYEFLHRRDKVGSNWVGVKLRL